MQTWHIVVIKPQVYASQTLIWIEEFEIKSHNETNKKHCKKFKKKLLDQMGKKRWLEPQLTLIGPIPLRVRMSMTKDDISRLIYLGKGLILR